MHLILTGATGLVGSGVLQNMLTTNSVTKVSVLSRRPVPMAEGNPKAEVIIHKDYTSYPPELLEKLKGAEGIVWAQGVSSADVSKAEYEKITFDYPLAAAKAFSSLSNPFKFVYVSGEGTTTTPGFFTMPFGRVKGRAEAALLEMSKTTPSFKPYSLRPALVDPKDHTEIHSFMPSRQSMRFKIGDSVAPAVRMCWPSGVSPTKDLGRVLMELAMSDGMPHTGEGVLGEGRTFSNVGFRRLAGL